LGYLFEKEPRRGDWMRREGGKEGLGRSLDLGAFRSTCKGGCRRRLGSKRNPPKKRREKRSFPSTPWARTGGKGVVSTRYRRTG